MYVLYVLDIIFAYVIHHTHTHTHRSLYNIFLNALKIWITFGRRRPEWQGNKLSSIRIIEALAQ